jgi:hypothetical protein
MMMRARKEPTPIDVFKSFARKAERLDNDLVTKVFPWQAEYRRLAATQPREILAEFTAINRLRRNLDQLMTVRAKE